MTQNIKRILYLSRPFENDSSGTGEQRVAAQVVKNLKSKAHNVAYVKHMKIKPYHGIESLIFYDILVTFCRSVKNLIIHSDVVVFNSPYQGLFVTLFKLQSRTVCICNDTFFASSQKKNYFEKYSYYLHMYVLKRCDRVITTSDETKQQLHELFRIESKVAFLGTDFDDSPLSQREHGNKIGYIGSYVERKRPQYLVALAQNLKKSQLVLILAGKITKTIKDRVTNIPEVTLLGIISDEQKVSFYSQIDFLYFPTELEGFGLPLVDAMRTGVIPIVHNDAIIPDSVKKYCVSVNGTEDLLKVIKDFSRSPSKQNTLRSKNYNYSKKFNWSNFTDQILR